jgi:hypothetical protein
LSSLSFAGLAGSAPIKPLPPIGFYVYLQKGELPSCIALTTQNPDRSFVLITSFVPTSYFCTTSLKDEVETGQFRCINLGTPNPDNPGASFGFLGTFSASSLTVSDVAQYEYGNGVDDPGLGVTLGVANFRLAKKVTFKPDVNGLCTP